MTDVAVSDDVVTLASPMPVSVYFYCTIRIRETCDSPPHQKKMWGGGGGGGARIILPI